MRALELYHVADATYSAWVTETEFRIETTVTYDIEDDDVPPSISRDTIEGHLVNDTIVVNSFTEINGECSAALPSSEIIYFRLGDPECD